MICGIYLVLIIEVILPFYVLFWVFFPFSFWWVGWVGFGGFLF